VEAPGRPTRPVVLADDVVFGGPDPVVIGGPCAVESEEQALRLARAVAAAGGRVFRGGAYKPRTSPYSFQGLGRRGLEVLRAVKEETGLLICTEALDVDCIDDVAEVADLVQIGSRNMDNPTLLKRAGALGKPILLKRGFAATLDELLLAAEYVLAHSPTRPGDVRGAPLILCERGIRTFCAHSRNTLDLHAVLRLRARTDLPIIVDPSHAAGLAEDVAPLARAALAVGADGLIVEVHDRPHEALSDGEQAISPATYAALVADAPTIRGWVRRR
jgi:3-deoxy-7-phosphoheptulonate synthase